MKRNTLNRKTKSERIAFMVAFIIFFIFALSYLYIFFWAIISSFKTNREFFKSPFSFPEKWMFKNYVDSFKMLEYNGNNYLKMLFNSLWFSLGTLIINLCTSSCTAYVLAKYKFKGRNFIYSTALFVMIIPIMGSLPAYYKLVSDLKIINSPLFLITATSGFGYNFFILYSFFKNLSWSYAEAAFMDGATDLQVFLKVMLPQAFSCVFALAIMGFIGYWNDYMTPILYLDSYPTISSGLYYYQEQIKYASNEPVFFAGVIISTIPPLILYIFFQKTIMDNVVTGGLKG